MQCDVIIKEGEVNEHHRNCILDTCKCFVRVIIRVSINKNG